MKAFSDLSTLRYGDVQLGLLNDIFDRSLGRRQSRPSWSDTSVLDTVHWAEQGPRDEAGRGRITAARAAAIVNVEVVHAGAQSGPVSFPLRNAARAAEADSPTGLS